MAHVGIYGGSFNPPHLAHLIVAETVREQFALDQILWIPNALPPHKPQGSLASPVHRLAMVALATRENPVFAVSDVEMQREGVSYTVDTVRTLQEAHPAVFFSLLLGGDSFRRFGSWHRPEEIASRVPLIVYRRPGAEEAEAPPRFAERVRFATAPLLEISGAVIRARRRAGQSIRYLVPDDVRTYIDANALYLA